MQIIAKIYIVQEVPGNVGDKKGVNGKYYFSIYEIKIPVILSSLCA